MERGHHYSALRKFYFDFTLENGQHDVQVRELSSDMQRFWAVCFVTGFSPSGSENSSQPFRLANSAFRLPVLDSYNFLENSQQLRGVRGHANSFVSESAGLPRPMEAKSRRHAGLHDHLDEVRKLNGLATYVQQNLGQSHHRSCVVNELGQLDAQRRMAKCNSADWQSILRVADK